MKTHTALAAWLPTAREVEFVELLTVTTPTGGLWRYASSVDNVTDAGITWLGSASAGGLLWERSRLTFKAGIALSECTLTLQPRAGDLINSLPVAQALRARAWDSATVLLSRAYFDATGLLKGILPRYQGTVAPMRFLDGTLEITLKPPSQTLNRAVPPVYQDACHNTLFDTACGVSRPAYTVTGTVSAGSTTALVQTGRGEAASYFNGGVLVFTSGLMAGLPRTVRSHSAGGALSFFEPYPLAATAGDAYSLTPGCDRSLGAGGCSRFGNRLRFRGTPFIPLPETAI